LFKRSWTFLCQGIEAFVADDALSRGAAISFYAVTALGPILFITVSIAGAVFGRDAAGGEVMHELARLLGPQNALVLHSAIQYGTAAPNGLLATIIGIVTLVFTASGIFTEMHAALNAIWHAPVRRAIWWRMLRAQAVSIALVAALGILLMASLGLSALSHAMGPELASLVPFSLVLLSAANIVGSYFLIALLFAAIYKFLPDRELEWRDVGVGALGTAFLFEAGKYLIGLYLGSRALTTAYGAAGGLILLLLWVYYSTQVFLLGAEFTKIYANARRGGEEPPLTPAKT
jgi:membrane protein